MNLDMHTNLKLAWSLFVHSKVFVKAIVESHRAFGFDGGPSDAVKDAFIAGHEQASKLNPDDSLDDPVQAFMSMPVLKLDALVTPPPKVEAIENETDGQRQSRETLNKANADYERNLSMMIKMGNSALEAAYRSGLEIARGIHPDTKEKITTKDFDLRPVVL